MTQEEEIRINTAATILSGLLANPNLLNAPELEREKIEETTKWFIERADNLAGALIDEVQLNF